MTYRQVSFQWVICALSSQDDPFAPTTCKHALARAVTLMLFGCEPYYSGIYTASATAKNRWFDLSDIVPVRMIPNQPLRWPTFSTTTNTHVS